jgi:lipoprotein
MNKHLIIVDIIILFFSFMVGCLCVDFIFDFVKAIDNDIRCNETYYVDFDNNEGKADYCDRTLACSVDGIKIQAKKVYYKNVC